MLIVKEAMTHEEISFFLTREKSVVLDRQRSQTLRLAHHPGISAWNEVPEPPGLRSHLLLKVSGTGIGLLPLLSLKNVVFGDRETT